MSPYKPVTPFACAVEPDRDVVRVAPAGELDLSTASAFDDTVRDLLQVGFRRISIDLRELTFIDSSGLQVMVDLARRAAAARVELELVPGPSNVQRAFALCGLESILPFARPGGGGAGAGRAPAIVREDGEAGSP